MKKTTTLLLAILLVIGQSSVFAQDSSRPGAVKILEAGNERADRLKGKTIRKESLSKTSFEKLDTLSTTNKKKTSVKRKRKHT